MRINLPVRLKNKYFWIGLLALTLQTLDISPESLTNWSLVLQALSEFVSNPISVTTFLAIVLGIAHDPTTKGLGDSEQALSYHEPK
jgi:phi LC3 family holin